MLTRVTIGICAKDCEENIPDVVDRISSQDFPHEQMEVIFVEEDSTDNTLSLILKQAPKMNVKYKVYHLTHKGLGFSRNIILQNARGEYIVWIDDGTVISRDYVRKLVEVMERNPNIGIAIGMISLYSGKNYVASLDNMSGLIFSHEYAGKFTDKLPGTGGAIFRVKAMIQVGGFDDRITGADEDMDIAYRLSLVGWKIFVTRKQFSRDYSKNIGKVWAKAVWYGYGLHFILHKHRELHKILSRSTPVAGFLEGILRSFNAYKLTYNKMAFFLPLFFAVQRTACCFGFLRAHLDSYGHY